VTPLYDQVHEPRRVRGTAKSAARQRRNWDKQVTGSMACRAFAGRSSHADNIFSDSGAISFPDCAGKRWRVDARSRFFHHKDTEA
jgi:hypothetical protein